jgi:hypothetical protein
MQMYKLKFARCLPGDRVDIAEVAVCASSAEQARDLVAQVYELGASAVEWGEVTRIKPSVQLLSRREVSRSLSTATADVVDVRHASTATFPDERPAEEYWHVVSAVAEILAENDEHAAIKLARAIRCEMAGEPPRRSCKDLEISCERVTRPRSIAPAERQALYNEVRLVPGGAGRPR